MALWRQSKLLGNLSTHQKQQPLRHGPWNKNSALLIELCPETFHVSFFFFFFWICWMQHKTDHLTQFVAATVFLKRTITKRPFNSKFSIFLKCAQRSVHGKASVFSEIYCDREVHFMHRKWWSSPNESDHQYETPPPPRTKAPEER